MQELNALTSASERSATARERLESIAERVTQRLEVFGIALGLREVIKGANRVRELADRYEMMGAVVERMGHNQGQTTQQVAAAEAAMRKQGATMVDARDAALSLLRAHISLGDATKLMAGAQDIATRRGSPKARRCNNSFWRFRPGWIARCSTPGSNSISSTRSTRAPKRWASRRTRSPPARNTGLPRPQKSEPIAHQLGHEAAKQVITVYGKYQPSEADFDDAAPVAAPAISDVTSRREA